TTLHDSTGTGTGSVDWNFNIADSDLDYLAAGETLTVNYNVKVSDPTTNANQTVSVVITGANDAPTISSGPESGSVSEQAGVTGSTSLDTTSPDPTGTLNFTDVDLSHVHSVQDKDLDFLAAGETMTVTYDVTVLDASGASSTQQVTVTATGAADTLLVNS